MFAAKVLGPHFEELAREWVRWYAPDEGIEDVGQVGTTVVACRAHGGHEVDVVGLSRGSVPRTRSATVTLLGEAKATSQPRDVADLRRLGARPGTAGGRGCGRGTEPVGAVLPDRVQHGADRRGRGRPGPAGGPARPVRPIGDTGLGATGRVGDRRVAG